MDKSDLELYGIVGKMFREIRENKGYTLKYVSDYLDIAFKTLQRYELGERDIKIDIIKKLCEFYKIDCSLFMKDATLRFTSERLKGKDQKNFLSELKKGDATDECLQEIIDCYNNMTDEGKNLLLKQARYHLGEYPKIVGKREINAKMA